MMRAEPWSRATTRAIAVVLVAGMSGCASGAKMKEPARAPAGASAPEPTPAPIGAESPAYAAPTGSTAPAPSAATKSDDGAVRELTEPPAPPPAKKSAPGAAPSDAARGEAGGGDEEQRGPAMAGVEHRLSSLAREVASAVGARDCPSACRALDSMEKAAAQVCRLVANGERDRCDRAQATARSARERVTATCGGCSAR